MAKDGTMEDRMHPGIEAMLARFRAVPASGEIYADVEEAAAREFDALPADKQHAIFVELRQLTSAPEQHNLSESDMVFLRRAEMYAGSVVDPEWIEAHRQAYLRAAEVAGQAGAEFSAMQAAVGQRASTYNQPAPTTGLGCGAFIIGLVITVVVVLAIIGLIVRLF